MNNVNASNDGNASNNDELPPRFDAPKKHSHRTITAKSRVETAEISKRNTSNAKDEPPPAAVQQTTLRSKSDPSSRNKVSVKDLGSETVRTTYDATSQYTKKKCLVIHDQSVSKFDSKLFNSRYDVWCHNSGSVFNFLKKSEINGLVAKHKPDVIFFHLGLEDLVSGTSVENVSNMLHQAMWYLVEAPGNHCVCMSLIPPCDQYRTLNNKITDVNKEIFELVTDIRRRIHNGYARLYSVNNSLLGGRMKHVSGEGFKLTEHGQKLMWVQLRYGFQKSLNLSDSDRNQRRNTHSNLKNHE